MQKSFYFDEEDLSSLIVEFIKTMRELGYSCGFIGESLAIILRGLYCLQSIKEEET